MCYSSMRKQLQTKRYTVAYLIHDLNCDYDSEFLKLPWKFKHTNKKCLNRWFKIIKFTFKLLSNFLFWEEKKHSIKAFKSWLKLEWKPVLN